MTQELSETVQEKTESERFESPRVHIFLCGRVIWILEHAQQVCKGGDALGVQIGLLDTQDEIFEQHLGLRLDALFLEQHEVIYLYRHIPIVVQCLAVANGQK